MGDSLLVAYASRHGATAEVAEVVADTLRDEGETVELAAVEEVSDVGDYGAVVLGAPLYSANWLEEATAFVKANQSELGQMPAACFVLAIRLRDNREDIREAVMRAISTERIMMQPVSVGMFGGALHYDNLSAITRLQVETKGLPEGDFRDWDAIREWARALPAKLS